MLWSDFEHFRISGSIIYWELFLSLTRCFRGTSSFIYLCLENLSLLYSLNIVNTHLYAGDDGIILQDIILSKVNFLAHFKSGICTKPILWPPVHTIILRSVRRREILSPACLHIAHTCQSRYAEVERKTAKATPPKTMKSQKSRWENTCVVIIISIIISISNHCHQHRCHHHQHHHRRRHRQILSSLHRYHHPFHLPPFANISYSMYGSCFSVVLTVETMWWGKRWILIIRRC